MHNGSNTIGSYSVSSSDKFPISLPSVIPSDPRFSFFGWTTNSTISLSDSPTAPSEITTSITETPSSATTDLYPIFAHYRQNSFPEIITIIPDSNNKEHLFIPFPLSDFQAIASDAILASLHVHIKGSLHNTMHTTFSFSSPTNKTDIIATFADTHIEQFYPLTINTFIPIGLTGTIVIHRMDDPLTVDSIVAITYPNPEPRYYTSIPATTPDNDLTINLSDPVNVTTSLTATDAVTYSMTIDDSRFYFLSLPFAAPFNNTTITPITGPHPRTYYYGATDDAFLGDYVISDYDETTHSWHDLTKTELETNGFQPNHGYTIGLTQPGTKATFTFRTANAPITISPSQPETIIQTPITNPSDKRNAGWNLIGNPYVTPLDPTQVCTEQGLTLNYILIPNDNNSYDIVSQYSEDEIPIIPPFTSFFIQSTTPTTIINPQATSNTPAGIRQTTTPIYHFNIVCMTPDSTKSVLTILSNDSLTDDYETSFDLLSLSPETDITHDGLAIYASSIQPGDTIPINIPTSDATLSLGHNILIPENWTIEILPDIPAVTIIDNTPASLDNIDETPDTPIQIFTIDGRLIFTGNTMPTNLTPATYIIRTPRKTQKTIIK
ncbi:MAG: hypothetical protein MJ002_05545 [Paludibacteraceae bacterium]|nr:hypothetical protein [Paludibacteraceae bacterium]